MSGNAVKTIVLLMVLVVLSILIGAQVSDGIKESFGAFAVVACVVLLFVMLWLGTNSWKLLYWLPPILSLPFISIPYGAFIVAGGVLIYWAVMRIMGYVRFTWHGYWLLDGIVLVLFLYMAVSFYRHPVVLRIMDVDYEYIGGQDYIAVIGALVYYVTLSCIPVQYSELQKTLKTAFIIAFGSALVAAFYGILNPSAAYAAGGEDAGDVLKHGRFSFFSGVGAMLAIWVYTRYRVGTILTSLQKLFLVILGASGVLISGWRSRFATFIVSIVWVAYIKREIAVILVCSVLGYGGLFMLGHYNVFVDAPYGLQRVLTVFPGINVSKLASAETKASSEIRKEAWKMALDPHTGLIKDYLLGDGFQVSRSHFYRQITASQRGFKSSNFLVDSGLWHNGYVTFLHRIGIVGIVIQQSMFCVAIWMLCRIGFAIIHTPQAPYVLQPMLTMLPVGVMSWYLVYMVHDIFFAFVSIALVKLCYVLLMKEGFLRPVLSRERYTPLMIRSLDEETL